MTRILTLLMLFPVAALADDKKPGEWTNLLDGDLAKHWTTKGNWKLESDGSVTLTPRPGEKGWSRFDAYLWSKSNFTDFEAEFEYKVEAKGNSGFYFHVGDASNPVNKGTEVQIFDTSEKLTDHSSGGVIPGIPPKKHAAKPAGEWNKMLVTVKSEKLTITLNGEVVNEVNLNEGKLKDRPKSGIIGFQDHGLPLALRNIKVREIK
jgi:hypothetical protein